MPLRPFASAFRLCSLAVLIAASCSAQGQEGVEPADAAAATAPASVETIAVQQSPAPAAKDDGAEDAEKASGAVRLDSVVVTGEKVGRSLLQTSSSVSVKTARDIEAYGIDSVSDAVNRTANAMVSTEGDISMRGVDMLGVDAGGGVNGGQPLISTYVDGIALDGTAQIGNLLDLFDVDQVEILRGAQSTSQGRNALAGAVVVDTREPTENWDLRTRLRLADFNGREYAAAGGGPLGGGLSFRLVGDYQSGDGYINNPVLHDPKWDRREDTLWRGKLAWNPAFAPDLSALLTIGTTRRIGSPDTIHREADADGAAAHRTDMSNVPTTSVAKSLPASLRLRYRFDDHFELTSTTGRIGSEAHRTQDYDGTAQDSGTYAYDQNGGTLTQELRLNLQDWHGLTGVAGLYGGRYRDGSDYHLKDFPVLLSEVVAFPPLPGGVTPPNPLENIAARVDSDTTDDHRATNVAGFGELDWAATERLTLTAGLRYDHERSVLTSNYVVTRADAYVVPPQQASLIDALLAQVRVPALVLFRAAGIVPGTGNVQHAGATYHALLPKGGLRYALTPDLTAFITYSEAYRAGGADVDTNSGDIYSFKPEYTQTLETGLRAKWLDDRAFTQVNVYATRWRDQQVIVPIQRENSNLVSFRTENAANSALWGAELENRIRIGELSSVYANLGYAHTQFEHYVSGSDDYSGHSFVNAPRWTGGLGGITRTEHGGFASLSYTMASSYFTTPQNDPRGRGDARRVLDAKVGWEKQNWSVYAFGRNLLDQDYATYRYPIVASASVPAGLSTAYGAPRVFGVQLEARL